MEQAIGFYRNALTRKTGRCRKDGEGYADADGGVRLLLYESPFSHMLSGIEYGELAGVQTALRDELRSRLAAVKAADSVRLPALADELSRVISGRAGSLSLKAEVLLELPADARLGRNRARLRDQALLTAGIASALAREWLLRGGDRAQLCGSSEIDAAEALAVVRLAAFCHALSRQLAGRAEERGEATRELFSGLLDDGIVALLAQATQCERRGSNSSPGATSPETLLQQMVCYAAAAAAGDDLSGTDGDDVSDWERERFGEPAPLALVAADADRVHGYVFESAKLPEMRGASLILDWLNAKDSDNNQVWGKIEFDDSPQARLVGTPQMLDKVFGLPYECLIYAVGGGLLLIAPREQAEKIAAEIERLYVETTLVATTTAVWLPAPLRDLAMGIEPLSADWFDTARAAARGEAARLLKDNAAHGMDRGRFGHLQVELSYMLRRAKDFKPTAPLFEASPYSERCAYCHLRPSYDLSPGDEDPICRACLRKRQDRNERAQNFYLKRFKAYLEKTTDSVEEPPYLEAVNIWDELEPPPDLEAIAEAGSERKFIGVIYADGNDIGGALESLETIAAYKSFAREVRDALERAVFSGLGSLIKGSGEARRERERRDGRIETRTYAYHPFEIVSIGGDDVYLFVPADIALELALRICKSFEESFDRRLTLSAGVLIAQVNTPVYFTRSVVKGLLKSAKSLSKPQNPPVSAIDYQVITADTAIGEDIGEFRAQAYRNSFDEGLTTRPMKLDDLERTLELARRMKTFPKSQLYALREVLAQGPQPRATNFYFYQKTRKQEAYAPLHEFLAQGADERHLPFRRTGGGPGHPLWETAVIDLVEILDFV